MWFKKIFNTLTKNILYLISISTILFITYPISAQSSSSSCYMIDSEGNFRDLSNICGQKTSNNNSLPLIPSNKPTNEEKPKDNVSLPEKESNTPTEKEEVDRSKLPAIQRTIPLIQKQKEAISESKSP